MVTRGLPICRLRASNDRSPKQVTREFLAFLRTCVTFNRPASREKESYALLGAARRRSPTWRMHRRSVRDFRLVRLSVPPFPASVELFVWQIARVRAASACPRHGWSTLIPHISKFSPRRISLLERADTIMRGARPGMSVILYDAGLCAQEMRYVSEKSYRDLSLSFFSTDLIFERMIFAKLHSVIRPSNRMVDCFIRYSLSKKTWVHISSGRLA